MSGPSDAIKARLLEMLREADKSTVTTRALRKDLESEFDTDLTEHKDWLKGQVTSFVERDDEEDDDDDDEEDEEDEDEEEGEKKEQEDPNHPLISDEMAAVCGVSRANHFRCVKLIWKYIKAKDLQNPKKKNEIQCDAKLKAVFKQDTVTSFGMTKLIGAHIIKKDEETPPRKAAKKSPASSPRTKSPDAKNAKKGPYRGSKELADFLGEEVNNFFTITKHLWAYIKEHDLQDPADRRQIVCDDSLKQLLGVDRFSQFHMSKLIKKHFPA